MTIFFPMALLALLTIVFALILVFTRFYAVSKEHVDPRYFVTLSGHTPPDYVQKTSRHWANLFELPILFYVVCLAILTLHLDDETFVIMGYAFVASRLLHGFIHCTYNNVYHRLYSFAAGMIIVTAMWIRLLMLNL